MARIGKKQKNYKHSSKIKEKQPPDSNKQTIIFSLERVQGCSKNGYEALSAEERRCFADAVFKRRLIIWQEIIGSNKHALGCEKMPIKNVSKTRPQFMTPEETHYLVLRYKGKLPMIGYRQGRIFYVLWFAKTFSCLYKH